MPSIQEAITLADPGDQIWVKQGVFSLTQQIEVTKDVELYGGVNGSEHYLSDRDLQINITYVDGQNQVRCFSISKSAGTVFIDGFCIRNGYSPSWPGGGISNKCAATSLTIANCTFSNNHASQGGGVSNSNTSLLRVMNCLFEDNSASGCQTGGGLYSSSTNTKITNCIFNANMAGGGGGITFFNNTSIVA